LDFVAAQEIWQDPNRLTLPAAHQTEPRQLVVGRISGKAWTAIITWRGMSVRLISVRRSRAHEIQLYEAK